MLRKLTPVPFTAVDIQDRFWSPRLKTNHEATIPHVYDRCEATGRINSFRLMWQEGDPNKPHVFRDSDAAKWLEAACYSLQTTPDANLRARVDEVAGLISGAQREDGYLNTYFTLVEPDQRWANLRDWHELYCAGHLMEAAVAHHQATGDDELLNTMCRYADYIESVFGTGEGQMAGYPGHEEIELALVKLYHATGESRYLDLSRYFVEQRGQQPHYFDIEARQRGEDPDDFMFGSNAYSQSHVPVRQQTEAVGHAVRATYLYSSMADLAMESDDETLAATCKTLWEDMTTRKMYITGGIGANHRSEDFGAAYDLPSETAYAETCASIGLVFFAHRMLMLDPDGRYADVLERALYNNILAGVGLGGRDFFYVNPLASAGDHHRQSFYETACCPPNVARLLGAFGQYIYSTGDKAIYTHLYIGGRAQMQLNGTPVSITQQANYPWDETVTLQIDPESVLTFDLMLRIPDWCRSYSASINGETITPTSEKGYARLNREWQPGDVVELTLAMPVERMVAHPQVKNNAGRIALQRGPVVYCLEQVDHTVDLDEIRLPQDADLTATYEPDLLGGVVVITGEGRTMTTNDRLYAPLEMTASEPIPIKAVPYYAWDHREAGKMRVWIPY